MGCPTPALQKGIPTATSIPTPTLQRAIPTKTPASPSLTIGISPNPVELGGQVTVSGTGVPGNHVSPYINGVCCNDGYDIDSSGHYSHNEKVSAPMGEGLGITQPGTYEIIGYDNIAGVHSNTVSLVVTSGTLGAPAFNLPANSTVTATPGAAQTPGPEATVAASTGNDTMGNVISVTPAAERTSGPTVTPLPSGTARPSPAFPMDAAAIVLVTTGTALLAMKRSRKD